MTSLVAWLSLDCRTWLYVDLSPGDGRTNERLAARRRPALVVIEGGGGADRAHTKV
ncbi:MAG TPA: hypothetical protein VM662_00200 [Sphingomonas sp.]|nr:hypothetical protein [Sphingomonas sp.]